MEIEPFVPAKRRGFKVMLEAKKNLLGYFVKLMQEEGAFAWYSIAGNRILMLNDATAIQHVLQDNFEGYKKAKFNQVLKPILGNSIFLTEGKTWRHQRQETAPVFSNKNFEEMTMQMVSAVEAMFQRWDKQISKGVPVGLNLETMWFTLDVVLRALFHEIKDGIAGEMQTALVALLREAEQRIWAPLSLPQSWVLKLPKYKAAQTFLEDTVQGLISARRANNAYPEDLLSRLIKNYQTTPGALRTLRDQVMAFLLAGHETTANGLAWTFYHLSLYPKIQEEVMAEVDRVLGGAIPTLENVMKLTYTRQVFDETLRLYPPVWTMSREALQDDLIPLDAGDKLKVSKGTTIMLSAYAVHRREAYWENPEAFDPTRFAPEQSQARPKYAWFPFSGGPRLCLGFRFAQIESIVALAMIAQKYKLSLVPGQNLKPEPNITLRPNGPMLFKITPRNEVKIELPEIEGEEPPVESKCPFHKIFAA